MRCHIVKGVPGNSGEKVMFGDGTRFLAFMTGAIYLMGHPWVTFTGTSTVFRLCRAEVES